eukprot:c7643_g1_i1.p1 GENE.c7643_g1_i1~~c7643_g1_i1.p1  ORF type:complete len:699 (-),score=187.22 c7643_g1_i1:123-2219(-)
MGAGLCVLLWLWLVFCRMNSLRIFVLLGLVGVCLADMPSAVISTEDAKQLIALVKSKPADSAKAAFQIAKSVEILGGSVSDIKNSLCAAVSKFEENDVDELLHAVLGNNLLGCENAPSPATTLVEKLGDVVEEESDLKTLLPALRAYIALGKADKLKVDPEALAPIVTRLEELQLSKGRYQMHSKDDQGSYLASGRAWYVLAIAYAHGNLEEDDLKTLLAASEGVSAMLKVLQKELGDSISLYISEGDNKEVSVLQTTSEALVGFVQLSRALTQDLDVTPAQMDKFASFFLLQKDSLHSVEDVFYFATALAALADNPISVPLAAILKQRVLQQSGSGSGSLTLSVTDLFDRPVSAVKVIAVRATMRGAVAPLLTNQEAFPVNKDSTSNTEYSLNFFSAKPEPGVYDVDFSVTPLETSEKKYPSSTAVRTVKVATSAVVSDVVISVVDPDKAEKKFEVAPKKQIGEIINVAASQSLTISLDIRSATSNKPIKPHQVFARFESETGAEAIFVIPFSDKKHKLTINIAEASSQFSFASGKYSLRIIVADANLLEPIIWDTANLALTFPPKSALTKTRVAYAPLPNIDHKFRQPDRRATDSVASIFTALVLAPVPILLIALLRIGFNFSNTPTDFVGFVSTILFFCSLGAIVGLLSLYWLSLSIFQALYGLMVLGPFTALVGARALSAIQNAAVAASKSKRE